ncbi:hypothetical protein VTO42DRAFT_7884 [Malbranchea cinnamomea]
MLSARNRTRRPRQDPVSCQFCRAKKLRCDRRQPCSNCTARDIRCQPAIASRAASQPLNRERLSPSSENAEILERLKRLEETVASMRNGSLLPLQSFVSLTASSRQLSPAAAKPNLNPDAEHRTTSEWLEGIGTRGDSVVSFFVQAVLCTSLCHSKGITIRVESVYQLLEDLHRWGDDSAPFLRGVRLPTKPEAVRLLKYYLYNVNYLHPVIHPPSVYNIIEAVYLNPEVEQYNKVSHIALLLRIFASTGHLWSPNSNVETIFPSNKAAADLSSAWSRAALDILEYSRRTTAGSIEDVQAAIIVAYLVFNYPGFSSQLRSLHSIILAMARDLSLHKVDATRRKGQEADLRARLIDDEIKRRIWWHIASTDWLLTFSTGPQQGTYSILPTHMCVNYPQNDDAQTISAASKRFVDSQSQTLSMTCFLQRVRLAELCRTIVDCMPRFLEDVETTVDYEHIIALDGKFEDCLQELPVFFRLDEGSRCASRDIERMFPQIATQRYLIHLAFNTRRSKLHQPFLVRRFVEPKYACSRDACLRCARTVLEINRIPEREKGNLAYSPAQLGTVVHHVLCSWLSWCSLWISASTKSKGTTNSDKQKLCVRAR